MEKKLNNFIESSNLEQNDSEYFDQVGDQDKFFDLIVNGEIGVDSCDIDDLIDIYL